MLSYTDADEGSKVLAKHYTKILENEPFKNFMLAESEIKTADEAILITELFWRMVDLSIVDNENNVIVDGVSDIEFWMHKLFNKVSGYMLKNGFEEQWDETTSRLKSEH